jgi:hypothetical protein
LTYYDTLGYVEDFTNTENEAALTVALEASRNEAAALKIAYNYANDKYNEMKVAYDKLINQLKEDVSQSHHYLYLILIGWAYYRVRC